VDTESKFERILLPGPLTYSCYYTVIKLYHFIVNFKRKCFNCPSRRLSFGILFFYGPSLTIIVIESFKFEVLKFEGSSVSFGPMKGL
jgi:hypothetical protein